MNLKLFQAARERLAKATSGPWVDEYLHEVSVEDEDQQDGFLQIALIDTHQNMSCDMAEANTKFIAHAPADLEAALAVIDVLVDAIERSIKEDLDDGFGRQIGDEFLSPAGLNLKAVLTKARELSGEKEEA